MVVAFGPYTVSRRPVNKLKPMAYFRDAGNTWAVEIVHSPPEYEGILDPTAVDTFLIEIHCEMQRLSAEFQHGQRACELLKPILAALRAGGVSLPIRIVDIGCDTGCIIR